MAMDGRYVIEKLTDGEDVFELLLHALNELTEGEEVPIRELLHHVKMQHDELWKKLSAVGVNNCSEKKLQLNEQRVRVHFDVSSDWKRIAPKGKLLGDDEFVKPIRLSGNLVDR